MNATVENLNQALCDNYLQCPKCRAVKSLKLKDTQIICQQCNTSYLMRCGIPALIDDEDIPEQALSFMRKRNNQTKINKNPYKTVPFSLWSYAPRLLVAELIYFFFAIVFVLKYGVKRIIERNYCEEVRKAIFYGWRNSFGLLVKAGETVAFNKMKRYIIEPSLEIGCGNCSTSNMLLLGSIDSVTFGCEYFMDTYMSSNTGESSPEKLSPEMYKLIKHYVGGSIKALPFVSDTLNSVYMVHIIDHITELGPFFKEMNRVIRPEGYLIVSGYSKYVFEHLPGVQLRKVFSRGWAEKYKIKRITKVNPYRGGVPLMNSGNYYATGMNMYSVDEWNAICGRFGFSLVDHAFFGNKYFSYFVDIEYRLHWHSFLFSEIISTAISEMIKKEKETPLKEKESTNIILVFQKKGIPVNEV